MEKEDNIVVDQEVIGTCFVKIWKNKKGHSISYGIKYNKDNETKYKNSSLLPYEYDFLKKAVENLKERNPTIL